MKRSILLAAALVASAAVSLEARDKQWKKGRIVNVESQMIAGNYERRLYYIDVGDDLIYVAWEKGSVTGSGAYAQALSFGLAPKKKRFAEVIINDEVSIAFEGDRTVFLRDLKGREVKLELYSKVRKADPPEKPLASEGDSSSQAVQAEIRKGMSFEEVEKALGKPGRVLQFERKAQWLYPRVVIVFDEGKVIDVSF